MTTRETNPILALEARAQDLEDVLDAADLMARQMMTNVRNVPFPGPIETLLAATARRIDTAVLALQDAAAAADETPMPYVGMSDATAASVGASLDAAADRLEAAGEDLEDLDDVDGLDGRGLLGLLADASTGGAHTLQDVLEAVAFVHAHHQGMGDEQDLTPRSVTDYVAGLEVFLDGYEIADLLRMVAADVRVEADA